MTGVGEAAKRKADELLTQGDHRASGDGRGRLASWVTAVVADYIQQVSDVCGNADKYILDSCVPGGGISAEYRRQFLRAGLQAFILPPDEPDRLEGEIARILGDTMDEAHISALRVAAKHLREELERGYEIRRKDGT